jgi:hypothetical protein
MDQPRSVTQSRVSFSEGSTRTRASAKHQTIATRRNPTTYPFEVQGPAAQQFPRIDLISRETVSQNEREISAIQESRSLRNDLRRRSISEWTQEPIGDDREDDQSCSNSRARPARCSADDGSQPRSESSLADWVVNFLRDHKVKHTAGDECGCQMSGKVVVQEELPRHQVEWQVVTSPSSDEESGIANHTVADTCKIALNVRSARID